MAWEMLVPAANDNNDKCTTHRTYSRRPYTRCIAQHNATAFGLATTLEKVMTVLMVRSCAAACRHPPLPTLSSRARGSQRRHGGAPEGRQNSCLALNFLEHASFARHLACSDAPETMIQFWESEIWVRRPRAPRALADSVGQRGAGFNPGNKGGRLQSNERPHSLCVVAASAL
jgi:hypothetical protein